MSREKEEITLKGSILTVATLGFYDLFRAVAGNGKQTRFTGEALTVLETVERRLSDGSTETTVRKAHKRFVDLLSGHKGEITADHVRAAARVLEDKEG